MERCCRYQMVLKHVFAIGAKRHGTNRLPVILTVAVSPTLSTWEKKRQLRPHYSTKLARILDHCTIHSLEEMRISRALKIKIPSLILRILKSFNRLSSFIGGTSMFLPTFLIGRLIIQFNFIFNLHLI